jgi:zinc-binding in reverse transcriptase
MATQRTDYLLENRQSLNLTRNLREWSNLSDEYDTNIYTSAKMIYDEMIERQNIEPRIEEKIWRNISLNHIPTNWAATTYLFLNDAIPNNVKMRRHNITDPPFCPVCGLTDDTNHRIKLCLGARDVWNFVGTFCHVSYALNFMTLQIYCRKV